jgi:oxygen-independent coproporphyrinogen-3 oxidase
VEQRSASSARPFAPFKTNNSGAKPKLSEAPCERDSRLGLYVHIPFCVSKCNYCDFNSYPGLERLIPRYLAALRVELARRSQSVGASTASDEVPTVYFGGGTPTLIGPDGLVSVLDCCRQAFKVDAAAEITVETNPGAVNRETLVQLRKNGFNRLSIGVQSFNDAELVFLGRIHNAGDARTVWRDARLAGFDNMSLDLIYGLPGQSVSSWRSNLDNALELEPSHLSLYALTIEAETPLGKSVAAGLTAEPDPDAAADMYLLAEDLLERAGYRHYEISNWALPGRECAHNLTYWRNGQYLGVGAGAHSYADSRRMSNVKGPLEYVRRLEEDARGTVVSESEFIDKKTAMGETMMLGLRLSEGVSAGVFVERFGKSLQDVYGANIMDLKRLGLVTWDGDRICLTARGRLLGNQVFCRFVGG